MRVITSEEMEQEAGSALRDLKAILPIWKSFAVPVDCGAKLGLARFVSNLFTDTDFAEMTIVISEWGIWPSSENFELFDSYRRAKGELRSIAEASVHQFVSTESDEFVSVLSMVLYFVWGAEIFNSKGTSLIHISHDEWFDVRTSDTRLLSNWIAAIEPLRLRELQQNESNLRP